MSHIGKRRSSNQDAFCALAGQDSPPGFDGIIAVADGMGGRRAGEVASSLAIRQLTTKLGRAHAEHGVYGAEGEALRLAIQQVNGDVHRISLTPQYYGMGTTLTAVLIGDSTLHLAHVGDTRAYLLREARLSQLTQDHSWVRREMDAGRLTAAEAANHPARNMLTRALGTAKEIEVDLINKSLKENDILLVCSDGLYSLVDDQAIARILSQKDPQQGCEMLIEHANLHGGSDNITAVIVRIDRLGAPSKRTSKPSKQTGSEKGLMSKALHSITKPFKER